MTFSTRRHFLHSSVALAGLSVIGSTSAIEPIRRPAPSRLRLSLAAYGYRKYLNLARKPKPTMTLFDFIDEAGQLDLDAVELTSYYFPETSPGYLAALKRRATLLGLDISGSAVGNDFCVVESAARKTQMASVKAWIEVTSRLGGKTLRIFAGRVPKGGSEDKARDRCVEAIQEACDYAGKYGVFLALENHGGITSQPSQMLKIVKAVKHDWFGVNLDTGNFHGIDPYAELEQIAPYAVNVQLKTEIRRAGSKKEEADLKRLVDIVRAVNYRGYIALEYEAAEDPKKAMPRHVAQLRKVIG